jgi:cytidylate kinase
MIITIDGPAGTGKSTIAKNLAQKLSFVYFDSGAMYRSIAWLYIKKEVSLSSKKQVKDLINDFHFEIKTKENGDKQYIVNNHDVSKEIRSPKITKESSQIATNRMVRKSLISIQRNFAKKKNVVFEGRDMGTVIFPKAEIKIFLTANLQERSKRRLNDLKEKFPKNKYNKQEISEEIKKRDEKDSNRKISPLRCAKDAVVVDTSDLSINEVLDKIISIIHKKNTNFFYEFILFLAKCLFKVFYRFKVYGLENFSPGPAIIVANHVSFYDPILVAISSPEEIVMLAKKSLFSIPILGKIIRKLNALPISRGSSDRGTLKEVLNSLQQGKKVLIFPEGGRSSSGEIQKILPGAGFLVYMSRCRIIPIYIQGSYSIWPINRKFPKLFGKINCFFGPPIEPVNAEIVDKREAIREISEKISVALTNLQKNSKKKKLRPR